MTIPKPLRLPLLLGISLILLVTLWWVQQNNVHSLSQQIGTLQKQIDALPAAVESKDKLALKKDQLTLEQGRVNAQNAIYGTLVQSLGGLFFFVTAYFTWANLKVAEENLQVTKDKQRDEETLNHIRSQIEDFYAPLYNLVTQLDTAAGYENELIKQYADDEKDKIHRLFQQKYFIPLHEEINQILKTKLHLIEGKEYFPPSFVNYTVHSLQERARENLLLTYEDLKSKPDTVGYIPYPGAFYHDIRNTLKLLKEKYEDYLHKQEVIAKKPTSLH